MSELKNALMVISRSAHFALMFKALTSFKKVQFSIAALLTDGLIPVLKCYTNSASPTGA